MVHSSISQPSSFVTEQHVENARAEVFPPLPCKGIDPCKLNNHFYVGKATDSHANESQLSDKVESILKMEH